MIFLYPKKYNIELNIIIQIRLHNKYNIQDIHRQSNKIKKQQQHTTLQQFPKTVKQIWFPSTYHKNISEKIQNLFKKHEINIAHKI